MAPNPRARAAHERLFPGNVSTLAETDPELIETFDNFALDEVPAQGDLDERTRLLVTLGALVACQAVAEYRVMLGAALTAGVTPVEAKEVVYHAVPYLGMAKVIDVLNATNEVLAACGVALPLPGQSTTTPRCGSAITRSAGIGAASPHSPSTSPMPWIVARTASSGTTRARATPARSRWAGVSDLGSALLNDTCLRSVRRTRPVRVCRHAAASDTGDPHRVRRPLRVRAGKVAGRTDEPGRVTRGHSTRPSRDLTVM
mgnify:CR=1 FL=1